MLSPYRVIDLTDERGLLCGQILADLGADVIQVEPRAGSPARLVGPWLGDESGPELSLFWWAYARNKRGIALDVEDEADRSALRQLVAGADFFIESEKPGRLAGLELGYEDLAALNPGLVYVSISAFGQDGPKAHWEATDLTLSAAGGPAYLSGEASRPPVRIRVPQAHAHAGADAAVGALIAHAERRRTGRGQHVDVSTQQSVTLATMFRILDVPLQEAPARRRSGGVLINGVFIPSQYPLKDGWVILGPGFLPSTGHFGRRLFTWVAEEGYADSALAEEDWGTFALRLLQGALAPDAYEPADRALRAFFASKTRVALIEAAVARKLLLAPVLGLDEIIDGAQFASRGFPTALEHPEGRTVRYPGPFARFSDAPIVYRRCAPLLDEHGPEIRAEAPRAPAPAGGAPPPALPLEGVKILDLFWVLAGPGATRMLADYGATVVHVESMRHIDTLRVIPPYRFNNAHVEGSGAFQSANANKLGLTLDLGNPAARDIVFDLVRWADVVTESFAPGVMDQYGFGWKTLRDVNPELVMISSCLMGQSGPWRDFTGFGNLAATVTGFQQLASWPGNPPSGPFGAYTDFIAVRYNAAAILAALEHRERTGRGQYIDQSQAEAALHFLAPAFLDYTANGRVWGAAGNEDGDLFPHTIVAASGEDRWVAIATRGESDWCALCDAMGRPDLVSRRDARAEVEAALEEWVGEREAEEVQAMLQARGVPAHEALDTPGLHACPQLQHRGHFIEVGHEIYQTTTVESTRLNLSRAQARRPSSALHFGRDNRAVLEGILGYPPEKIAELAERWLLI